MSRIFWDTMLFIYLLEGEDASKTRVEHLLQRSRDRGDSLFTSHLVLGEVLAGAKRFGGASKSLLIREILGEMRFSFLPFDAGAVEPFSSFRSLKKVKIADAINLSCAAAVGMDLFLTGDKELHKLYVPGIQFIADLDVPIL